MENVENILRLSRDTSPPAHTHYPLLAPRASLPGLFRPSGDTRECRGHSRMPSNILQYTDSPHNTEWPTLCQQCPTGDTWMVTQISAAGRGERVPGKASAVLLMRCVHSRTHTWQAGQLEVTAICNSGRKMPECEATLLSCLQTRICNFQNVTIHRNRSHSVDQPQWRDDS